MKVSCQLVAIIAVCFASAVYAYFPSFEVEYCHHNFDTRNIPELEASEKAQVKSLEQVQVVVRHGARTPWKAYQCWEGYSVTWTDCNVTELMLESPSYTSQSRPATWLFRKIYNGSPNYLKGNCYTGQLLLEGFRQEEAVGTSLYNAYIAGDLKLFPTNVWSSINSTEYIYLRSDDEQRTLMSGQILMHTFFNISEQIIVPWHTGDYGLDQIYPNSNVCPKLNDIEDEAYASPAWIAENTSAQVIQLNRDLDSILGKGQWSWNYIFDCMMTTVCTGRPIPDGNGAVKMSDAIFNATIAQTEAEESYLNLFNNSEYAKLSMGNTLWHIRQNIENVVNNISGTNTGPAYKLAVFAGHDTTIMPVLAAILGEAWDRVWPGYASLVTFELYQSISSTPENPSFMFRIVYNSKPLIVSPCTQALCDLNVLLDKISFAQEDMPCDAAPNVVTVDDDVTGSNCDDPPLSTAEWTVLTVMSSVAGILIGAAAVVFYDRRRLKHDFLESEKNPSSSPIHNVL